MLKKLFSSTGFFVSVLIVSLGFLVLQQISLERTEQIVARVMTESIENAVHNQLPEGVMGIGRYTAGEWNVVHGILPRLDPTRMKNGLEQLDSGVVLVSDDRIVYFTGESAGTDLQTALRIQMATSILYYVVLLWLAVMFYYFVFRSVRKLEGWVKGKSDKKRSNHRRISGRQLPMHGFTRIISGIEKIYSDLIHTEQEVERKTKLEALGVLFAKVLHDIKNNLASIKIYLYLMKTTGDEARRKELSQKVDAGMNDISLLIQDMLDFVRGSRSSLKEHVRIRDLYTGLKTEYNARARMDAVSFVIEMEDDIADRTIHVDMVRLVTALKHLILNAFEEVTAAGKPDPEVRIRLQGWDQQLQVDIIDNGRGIPEEIQERLFMPFVSEGKDDGNGIGTSVAKEYVEAQDGRIDFTTSDSGTVFMVQLPFSGLDR